MFRETHYYYSCILVVSFTVYIKNQISVADIKFVFVVHCITINVCLEFLYAVQF